MKLGHGMSFFNPALLPDRVATSETAYDLFNRMRLAVGQRVEELRAGSSVCEEDPRLMRKRARRIVTRKRPRS